MKTVTIYTDGACSGNPGPGGWCAILEYNGIEKMLSGGEAQTTNNRMELTAVIQALLALREPCIVELYSDSKYVLDGLDQIGQKTRAEPRPLGDAARSCQPARAALPLGQGPREQCQQQPLRPAGRAGEPEIQIKHPHLRRKMWMFFKAAPHNSADARRGLSPFQGSPLGCAPASSRRIHFFLRKTAIEKPKRRHSSSDRRK